MHAEACSVIVERVDMEFGALPPPLAYYESTSSFFCVLSIKNSNIFYVKMDFGPCGRIFRAVHP